MLEAVAARGWESDVVLFPDGAEVCADFEHLVDERGRSRVEWVASGFGAQDARRVVGDDRPVFEERPGGWVEEHVSDVVGCAGATVEDLRVDGTTERVGGQVVPAAVAD